MAYSKSKNDAALLALEVEIFDNDVPLTDNDEFLVRTFSHWSVEKRICAFSGIMKNYGQPNLGSHVAHALARFICQDVELRLNSLVQEFSHSQS